MLAAVEYLGASSMGGREKATIDADRSHRALSAHTRRSAPANSMTAFDPVDPKLLGGLFPDFVCAAEAPFFATIDDLLPPERKLIERAVDGRQREFATGRVLSRTLLAELGHARFALLRDADRVPIWPDSVCGSITHTAEHCVVALASSQQVLGIGLDIEPDEPTTPGIDRRVCGSAELVWLDAAEDSAERGRRCRLVFSAKEAVYKAFFPRIRKFWGFHDVAIEFDLAASRFEARLPAGAGRNKIEGRFARRAGFILTAVLDPR